MIDEPIEEAIRSAVVISDGRTSDFYRALLYKGNLLVYRHVHPNSHYHGGIYSQEGYILVFADRQGDVMHIPSFVPRMEV